MWVSSASSQDVVFLAEHHSYRCEKDHLRQVVFDDGCDPLKRILVIYNINCEILCFLFVDNKIFTVIF
jgi:hypothetical protein